MVRETKEGQRTQGGFGGLWVMKEEAVRSCSKKTQVRVWNSQEVSLSGEMRVVGSKALYDVCGNWLVQDGLNSKDRVWFVW